jgi:hypothetical protein
VRPHQRVSPTQAPSRLDTDLIPAADKNPDDRMEPVTVRLTGQRDGTAIVSCTRACRMPARSRDIAAVRAFAAAHARAHARAAALRGSSRCTCRANGCAVHEHTNVTCSGPVVVTVRHDQAVGRAWIITAVCTACAAATPHATVVARSAPPPEGAGLPASRPRRPAAAATFSSAEQGPPPARSRPRRPASRTRRTA